MTANNNKTRNDAKTPQEVYGYSFPAIRGIQAQREYYVSMFPIRLIPRILTFTDEEMSAEHRAQRKLNRARLPVITNYIIENKDSYVFSAITASIDGNVAFAPLSDSQDGGKLGILHIDMNSRFVINDGQHRKAAIERALVDCPELGGETIAVVFFIDPNLKRSQQMFADLNRYAIRPSPSLNILYDHREEKALLIKHLLSDSSIYKNLIETEKTSLSKRSPHLFTLSAFYGATNDLLHGMDALDMQKRVELAMKFWEKLAKVFKEWEHACKKKVPAGDIRSEFIHTHSVVLQALGRAGNQLLIHHHSDWQKRLKKLSNLDWRRSNPYWEGRAMIGGRISKAQQNVLLVTNSIKEQLGLKLSAEEKKAEEALSLGNSNGQI